MSIAQERKILLKRLRRDGRKDYKALSRRVRMPYSTFIGLVKGSTLGTIRSWIKIERFYRRREQC